MAHVNVVVPVPNEAAVLFVLPRLLRVGHREVVVLSHEPVAEARELLGCGRMRRMKGGGRGMVVRRRNEGGVGLNAIGGNKGENL